MFEDNISYVGEEATDHKLDIRFSRRVYNMYDLDGNLTESKEHDFITIRIPGDTTSVIDEIVREDHKRRFPRQWEAYQNNQNAVGTPLEDWTEITPELRGVFNYNGFRTIEQVAAASYDAFAMIMGGATWKRKAQDFINKQKVVDSELFKQQSAEIEQLKLQMAELLAAKANGELPKPKPKDT